MTHIIIKCKTNFDDEHSFLVDTQLSNLDIIKRTSIILFNQSIQSVYTNTQIPEIPIHISTECK